MDFLPQSSMNLIIRLHQNAFRSIRSRNEDRWVFLQLSISRLRFAINILPCFVLNEGKFIRSNSDNGTISFMELGNLERETPDAEIIVVRNTRE